MGWQISVIVNLWLYPMSYFHLWSYVTITLAPTGDELYPQAAEDDTAPVSVGDSTTRRNCKHRFVNVAGSNTFSVVTNIEPSCGHVAPLSKEEVMRTLHEWRGRRATWNRTISGKYVPYSSPIERYAIIMKGNNIYTSMYIGSNIKMVQSIYFANRTICNYNEG